eukprot:5905395-Alexandrium_andersonii.AAC.1
MSLSLSRPPPWQPSLHALVRIFASPQGPWVGAVGTSTFVLVTRRPGLRPCRDSVILGRPVHASLVPT